MQREIRAGISTEIRTDDAGVHVSGYAAIFNEEANIAGLFKEKIAPGAFSDAIKRDDVVFLIEHKGLPLARTRSGTLKLSQDERGLRMETILDPQDPDVKSIVGKMQRGDLNKMSFGFFPDLQDWDETQDPPLRTVKRASLTDVSIVSFPAYDGTDIALRNLEKYRKQKNFHAANKRLRMRMNLAVKKRENGI